MPFTLALPLLCLVALILRAAIRSTSARLRHEWTSWLCTLLIVSGIISSMAFVLALSLLPPTVFLSEGIAELDERTKFPALPSPSTLNGSDVSRELKPLVAVVSPGERSWFRGGMMPSGSLGAGVLLSANERGYLFATARHVVDGEGPRQRKNDKALIGVLSNLWSRAEVLARHRTLDLALLWVPRNLGTGSFIQPIAVGASVVEGEPVFIIGHPEGFKYTLASGLVSRLDTRVVQVSAPVSPGNSGGPVYDDHGRLVAIVSSTVDKSTAPNAENLNFGVRADVLLEDKEWTFVGSGQKRYEDFLIAVRGQGHTDVPKNR